MIARTASYRISTAASSIMPPSSPAERNSILPCPYGCFRSAGACARITDSALTDWASGRIRISPPPGAGKAVKPGAAAEQDPPPPQGPHSRRRDVDVDVEIVAGASFARAVELADDQRRQQPSPARGL